MIAVIGDGETVTGFRMAGVKDCYEASEKNLKEVMEKVRDKKVIIINERLYRIIEGDGLEGILIPVPDKRGSIGLDPIKKLIKEIAGRELEI